MKILENENFEKAENKTKLWNIIIMGMSFLLIFTAFQTMNGVYQTVIDSFSHFHSDQEVRSNDTLLLVKLN